jgi:hypothetical protein
MVKFKIKEGHPKMSVIFEHKKYVLADLKELPDDVFTYAMKNNIYGIEEIKSTKKVDKEK